jgi:type IV pilus assembly protein PilV
VRSKKLSVAAALRRGHARGFTLLEMLVALLVLSFGLLGMAGLQATGLRNNSNAYHRTQASVIALDIIERMRANRAAAAKGDYELALNASPPTSPSTQAERDLSLWIDNIEDKLKNAGDGSVTCALVPPNNRFVECTVVVQWTEIQDKVKDAADNTQFIVSTQL